MLYPFPTLPLYKAFYVGMIRVRRIPHRWLRLFLAVLIMVTPWVPMYFGTHLTVLGIAGGILHPDAYRVTGFITYFGVYCILTGLVCYGAGYDYFKSLEEDVPRKNKGPYATFRLNTRIQIRRELTP